jgi:hypothetical protein
VANVCIYDNQLITLTDFLMQESIFCPAATTMLEPCGFCSWRMPYSAACWLMCCAIDSHCFVAVKVTADESLLPNTHHPVSAKPSKTTCAQRSCRAELELKSVSHLHNTQTVSASWWLQDGRYTSASVNVLSWSSYMHTSYY